MNYNSSITINGKSIDVNSQTYFVADIAANHNGDLNTAKELIWLAKESGADAVKFQHFLANKIVSDYGFKHLGAQSSHQAKWKKSVYETYKDAEFNRDWNEVLAEEAKKADIDYFTSPYDFGAIDSIDPYVCAYKIGSGDITWIDLVEYIAKRGKPVMIATGASEMWEVEQAVESIIQFNPNIILMQCNTNYTGELENFKFINLNVLRTYSIRYPGMVLGLSDHTPGHATVLGAIALGARVIEKHFTADNDQVGPDHAFSMNPATWREMVDRSRELEYALGTGVKIVEGNENETVVLQRRSVRLTRDAAKGDVIKEDMLEVLRPAPRDAVFPYMIKDVIGKRLLADKDRGDYLRLSDVE
ncbi:MAG: N-acetylneuraminate synthase family protein [Lachnospiraceae bacterium]|nr:N-acetylneuraminate synthase family protein [Lachnospiraceae bacterium]